MYIGQGMTIRLLWDDNGMAMERLWDLYGWRNDYGMYMGYGMTMGLLKDDYGMAMGFYYWVIMG